MDRTMTTPDRPLDVWRVCGKRVTVPAPRPDGTRPKGRGCDCGGRATEPRSKP